MKFNSDIFGQAHPRAGGENSSAWWTVPLGRGSSPRGRGKQRIGLQSEEKGGLIPARAGKTLWWTRASRPARAHPRAGGENSRSSQALSPSEGSSPRGRGKLDVGGREDGFGRLIPARAGKTFVHLGGHPGRKAHPRAGGENPAEGTDRELDAGSSPRGRGKRGRESPRCGHGRLIPARAGKTSRGGANRRELTAHPRAGGENSARRLRLLLSQGSSPRGRGKPMSRAWRCGPDGLIPARAGKTFVILSCSWRSTAHPRAGGENSSPIALRADVQGSSPRGRGKLCVMTCPTDLKGLIPARAGKTLSDLRFYRADRSDLGNP